MTNIEAIQILTLTSQNEIGVSLHEALILAIEALEAREPVQVKANGLYYTCPRCGNTYRKRIIHDFCPACGQALEAEKAMREDTNEPDITTD